MREGWSKMENGLMVRHKTGGPLMIIVGREDASFNCTFWSAGKGVFETRSFYDFEIYRRSDLEYPKVPGEAFKKI